MNTAMKQEVEVDELRPGFVLSEPVEKDDSVLYHTGRKLSTEDIVLLKSWRIPKVEVESWSLDEDRYKN